MKQFFDNLVTLPYRAWMHFLGYYPMCTKCHTFVSGGFGGNDENGNHTFTCMSCAEDERIERNNLNKLKAAWEHDPNNERRV